MNLYNAVTGKCADLPGFGPGDPDGPVTQYTCNYGAGDNQRWTLQPEGSHDGLPTFQIKNVTDGLCLDLPDFGTVEPGTPVSQYKCSPRAQDDNQAFALEKTAVQDSYLLINVQSGLCLDVDGFSTGQDDARLTVWPCDSNDDHLWAFRQGDSENQAASHGRVKTASGAPVTVRTSPSRQSPKLGRPIASGTKVPILCQEGGEVVHGTYGSSGLWDRLVTGGYVSDAYVFTGSAGRVSPNCRAGDSVNHYEQSAKYDDALRYITGEMRKNGSSYLVTNVLHDRLSRAHEGEPSGFWGKFVDNLDTIVTRGDKGVSGSLIAFAEKVRPGGNWDHKPKLRQRLSLREPSDFYLEIRGLSNTTVYYDYFSNMHYGFVGREAGLTAGELFTGAELPGAGNPDPADRIAVQVGVDLADRYAPNQLTPEIVNHAIIESIPKYEHGKYGQVRRVR